MALLGCPYPAVTECLRDLVMFMHGKWLALGLIVTAGMVFGCKKTPTAASAKATPPPVVAFRVPGAPGQGGVAGLMRALAAYEWEPTSERTAAVWEAFADVDSRLMELTAQVSRRVGGARAEAEIERIELQRTRDMQMARFSQAQTRLETARAAFDALTASVDSEGIRSAATMVVQSLGSEARLKGRGWSTHIRGFQGRMEIP